MQKNKILVTGSSGYVGGRLVPKLLNLNFSVRVLVRNPQRIENKIWFNNVDVFKGNVLNQKSIDGLFEGVEVAYYLIHSMENKKDFVESDLKAANNFAKLASQEGVKKIIYLGGLADQTAKLSDHLRSRLDTGKELAKYNTKVIEFRANVIVGSGSLSFEMIRNLTERIPIMICPQWVYTKTQPIAISNILEYLIGALNLKIDKSLIIEIGGRDILTYGEMIREYAKVRSLNRYLIPIPVLTPKLSSYWVHWTTPLSANITKPLVEGLKNESIVKSDLAIKYFPKINLLSYTQAVKEAILNLNKKSIETSWTDSLVSSNGNDSQVTSVLKEGLIIETRKVKVNSSRDSIFNTVTSIGGDNGWYYANFLWSIRGYIDLLVGGVGLRRGRRHPSKLRQGDALDFWRVEKIIPNKLLRLKAEMKLPGKAWLEYEISGSDSEVILLQKAYFMPTGLFGLLYWYGLYPLHKVIFSGLVNKIKNKSES
ncbi:MAG: NAD(P)-dependent oxidoreductase [Euryarchaeota archaeon]|nr:NAD(P)-dependent oxidoreductase [Euryarchaeota archaeon]